MQFLLPIHGIIGIRGSKWNVVISFVLTFTLAFGSSKFVCSNFLFASSVFLACEYFCGWLMEHFVEK